MNLGTKQIIQLTQVDGMDRTQILRFAKSLSSFPMDDKELVEAVLASRSVLRMALPGREMLLARFKRGEQRLWSSQVKAIRLISIYDDVYPPLLRGIPDAPLILNVRGNVQNVEKLKSMPAITVIGTREPSKYGKSMAWHIGKKLAESGINVVSGLALGCDKAAHEGSICASGMTTAVLAHGLDMIYPKENSRLANEIVDTGKGVLVSEYLAGTRPLPPYFVARDRIQAALSGATLLIESDVSGGSMHTVNYARQYNRMLAVVDHSKENWTEKARGNRYLLRVAGVIGLRDGATIDNLIRTVRLELKRGPRPRM
jgi:DNA processing protein